MISMAAKEVRAHKRYLVSWDATLHQDGRAWECKVVDVSPGGAKIRIGERLTINSEVMLTIDRRGDFPGEVRWQDGNFAGICFLEDTGVVRARLRGSVAAHHASWRARLPAHHRRSGGVNSSEKEKGRPCDRPTVE
jgi:hypothetical protein